MEPKYKAKELIEKMLPQMYCYMGSGMLSNDYSEWVATANAQQCAQIICDEILLEISNTTLSEAQTEYWTEVKDAIIHYKIEEDNE